MTDEAKEVKKAPVKKAATYVVAKSGHYFRVNGKLQEVKIGDRLDVSGDVAKRLIHRGVIRKA